MNLFVCLFDRGGHAVPTTVQPSFEAMARRRELHLHWDRFGHAAVLVASDEPPAKPLLTARGESIAVGTARLDNRGELERLLDIAPQSESDLELVLSLVLQHGAASVSRILGDFAIVVYDHRTGTIVAACDAFAVKKLYYATRGNLLAFSSRAEALGIEGRYEPQVLAEWVAGGAPSPTLSAYAGVKPVPAGHVARVQRGVLTMSRYWSPFDFEPDGANASSEREVACTFRTLLTEAVRLRLSDNGDTWAQLSGGLDSSSVVSIAQSLAAGGAVSNGLVGTVTYVDRQGTAADERAYSASVVAKWQLRNELIVDPPIWYDARYAMPATDQPRPDLMFHPRERRLCEIVRHAGGRVLLTGQGSDELLRGNMFFFADWLAGGRVGDSVREMAKRAALGRVSFWELAHANAVLPLLPERCRAWLSREEARLPPWVDRSAARRYRLRERNFEMELYAGRWGHKYHDAVATCVAAVGSIIGHILLEDSLDVRHPFLYRPLVEYALRLQPELCVRPHARKWVLRQAMRDDLPEDVRTRIGKGTPNERHAWSLTNQRAFLEPLVQSPMLADLGVVDGAALRRAFDSAPYQPGSKGDPHGALQGVLSIEAWLQMRAGRWPRGGAVPAVFPEGTQ